MGFANFLVGPTGLQGLLRGLASELTIASGAIGVSRIVHNVDTESDAASDDLTDITGGAKGQLLLLLPESASRAVVINHGVGADKIACPGGQNITLSAATDAVLLLHNGTQFAVIAVNTLAEGGGGQAVRVQFLSKQVTHSDLTAAATSESINFDEALPANAWVFDSFLQIDTLFSGGSVSDFNVDIGIESGDTNAFNENVPAFTGDPTGRQVGTRGVRPDASGVQVAIDFKATGDNVANLTAGDATAYILYVVVS